MADMIVIFKHYKGCDNWDKKNRWSKGETI